MPSLKSNPQTNILQNMKKLLFNVKSLTLQNNLIFTLCAVLILASCNKDDEANVDVQKISGTFDVAETDECDEVETYTITIVKSEKGGANIEINNFGDFMYVPVKATVSGSAFTIPPQTFVGKKITIIVSGSGTFNGTDLIFNYSLDTGDDIILENSCIATKQGL
jgi:hypothetical protein